MKAYILDRQGFALPAAIGALVIIAMMVAAGFHVAQQEGRIGLSDEMGSRAFYMAERGASEVLENWDYTAMLSLPLFSSAAFVDTLQDGNWQVNVRRVGDRLFFLDAAGEMSEGGPLAAGATRRTGMMVRLLSLEMDAPAAITTRGDLNFNGAPPELSGLDRVPTGWSSVCSGPLDDQIGFLSDDSTSVMTTGGKGGKGKGGGGGAPTCVSQVTGAPCSAQDGTLVDQVMAPFEGQNWTDLTALADRTVTGNPGNAGPVVSGGVCDTSAPLNWGDPLNPGSPCGDYFPLIHFNNPGGETRLTGNGRGQGIFLFDGDLHIGGNYELYGLVIVNGGINSAGTPAITGAVIADSTYNMSGNPDVFYSSCALQRAVLNNQNLTRARPIENRSFVDLSNIGG